MQLDKKKRGKLVHYEKNITKSNKCSFYENLQEKNQIDKRQRGYKFNSENYLGMSLIFDEETFQRIRKGKKKNKKKISFASNKKNIK